MIMKSPSGPESPGKGMESSLKSLSSIGWVLGLFPCRPSNLKQFRFRSATFACYMIYASGLILILSLLRTIVSLQVMATRFESQADKITVIIRDSAGAISDFFIRIGFLLRAGSCVRLLSNIEEYNAKYARLTTAKMQHKIMKYISLFALNFVYFFWLMGIAARRLWLTPRREVRLTFWPSYTTEYSDSDINASEILFFGSTIVTSYYLSVFLILTAHVTLEFLEDFYTRLADNVNADAKTIVDQSPSYNSLNQSLSNLSTMFAKENGDEDSTVNGQSIHGKGAGYLVDSSTSVVNQAQFTHLCQIFYSFNGSIGIAIVGSIFADILMIITIVYNVFSSAEAFTVTASQTLEVCVDGSYDCLFSSYTNMMILLAEVEYESRIFITAVIGSYMSFRIKYLKNKLQELVYSFEVAPEVIYDTGSGRVAKRFVGWDWVLRGMDTFNINMRLLPSVLGTITTYVIVLLQVRMSENPFRLGTATAGPICQSLGCCNSTNV